MKEIVVREYMKKSVIGDVNGGIILPGATNFHCMDSRGGPHKEAFKEGVTVWQLKSDYTAMVSQLGRVARWSDTLESEGRYKTRHSRVDRSCRVTPRNTLDINNTTGSCI